MAIDKLRRYLDRIGYRGSLRPDIKTLSEIHAAHLGTIPFEDIDVQLGRPLTTGIEAAYDKIVTRSRGGWCYEQNGVLGWALGEIGFDVTRLAGGVLRSKLGEAAIGGHLCLRVTLDRPWLVDVGFGGSLASPIPLEAGARHDPPFQLSLQHLPDGYWRFEQDLHGEPFSYDFRDEPADEDLLAAKCLHQQTSPDSNFVLNLVAHRRLGDRHLSLRGRVLAHSTAAGTAKSVLADADELVTTLRDRFGLDVPEVATVWPRVCARHETLFGTGSN